MGLRDGSLYDFLNHNAVVYGGAPAAIDGKRSLSHRRFLELVERLGGGLADRGLAAGDRVCILAFNRIEYLELLGACSRLGAVACPLSWRLSEQEIDAVLRMLDPDALVVDEANLPKAEAVELSGLKVRAVMGEAAPDGFQAWPELDGQRAPDVGPAGWDDPFLILPTAAVAGVPRGAVLSHANLIMAGYQLMAALGLGPSDRHLAALPLFHVTGLGLSLAALQAGGANVVMQAFDAETAARWVDEHAVTLMADFPPILERMLEARQAQGSSWETLRFVLGLDSPEVIARLLSETAAQFWTGFGQAETTGVVTLARADERPGSAGKPLPLARLRCVDELGEDVPIGEPGEIVVQGPLVFEAYWRDADATDYTFRQGWHHTGDVGRFDQDGYLFYVGRKPEKELIKSGGENVYPAEVEQVIRELPEVSSVCVIGVPDPEWGEAVKAVVELAEGESLKPKAVQQAVAARIASFKKPRHVVFTDAMPRTPDGEVDRQAVKAKYGR